MDKWTNVKEELPPEDELVLVWVKDDNEPHLAYCDSDDGEWVDNYTNNYPEVTHWMLLPEPPRDS